LSHSTSGGRSFRQRNCQRRQGVFSARVIAVPLSRNSPKGLRAGFFRAGLTVCTLHLRLSSMSSVNHTPDLTPTHNKPRLSRLGGRQICAAKNARRPLRDVPTGSAVSTQCQGAS
jgi:hypothetical protein